MKDNFSRQSANYRKYRPDYPDSLFDHIYSYVKNFDHAWDCATGNGQVARQLAGAFKQVEASDISRRQLENAHQAPNIYYHVCPAENTPFKDDQFDLVTVAQALHWFDLKKFFKEINRVLKPSGVMAVWTYGLLTVSPPVDALILDFYRNVIGPYWDDERKHVDSQYDNINFPFDNVQQSTFSMHKDWSLSTLLGYIKTWSSVEKYIKTNGHDPVAVLGNKLANLWPGDRPEIVFPITMYIANADQFTGEM